MKNNISDGNQKYKNAPSSYLPFIAGFWRYGACFKAFFIPSAW
jgi:hypothetical protein